MATAQKRVFDRLFTKLKIDNQYFEDVIEIPHDGFITP